MKKPNFFIIGAPKCGTTSLVSWLAEHPNIYISPWKEPRYFDRDLKTRARISWEAYLALFEKASEEHIAVGEATVWYLYSVEAVPNIERALGGSRYIVMIRNPVEMAYALHAEWLLNGAETIKDFRKAWEMSPVRREGKGLRSLFISEPRLLDYQKVCSLGEQLERLYTIVPRERVLVLVLDDLRKDARAEYLRVLDFLGVPDDGRTDFAPRNPSKKVRSHFLQKFIIVAMKTERVFKNWVHRAPTVSQIWWKINAWNKIPQRRPPLSPEMRQVLVSYFAQDVQKLSELLSRDFSEWIQL